MAAEATAASLAAEGTSAGAGAFAAAGTAIKAFVLANPITLAGVAGIAIGVIGYRALVHPPGHEHAHEHEEQEEAAEASAT